MLPGTRGVRAVSSLKDGPEGTGIRKILRLLSMVCWCIMETSPRGFPCLTSPPPLPAAYKSLRIKYCLEDPSLPPLFWGSLPGRRLQTKQGEKKRMGSRQGCPSFINQMQRSVALSSSSLAGWAGSTASVLCQNGEHSPARVPLIWLSHPGRRESRGEPLSFFWFWWVQN